MTTPALANSHASNNGLPAWYLTLRSPHLTRAQALALSAPITGQASSTAPSAGSPNPARTLAVLSRLQSQYLANPTRFAAIAPKFASLFRIEAGIRAGFYPAPATVNGLVPTSPAWNYLRFRRSLDPARFDANHPQIGPLLSIDQSIRNQLDLPPQAQVINPPPGSPTPLPSPSGGIGSDGATPPTTIPPATPNPLPQAVPEPSSILLIGSGAAALAWFVVWQERRRSVLLQQESVAIEAAAERDEPRGLPSLGQGPAIRLTSP